MIETNVEKAEAGVSISKQISSQIDELQTWIEQVNTVGDEQIFQLKEIKKSIARISDTTDNTAGMAEKNASTAKQLQGQTHVLTNAIESINRKVDMNNSAASV